MAELQPIINTYMDKLTYTYNLSTSEEPKKPSTSETYLSSFEIHLLGSMTVRQREILKRKIIRHFERNENFHKMSKFVYHIDKIEICRYSIRFKFHRPACPTSGVMTLILGDMQKDLPFNK